ncbi:MAG: acyl carrier protein [Spartobacteria bacterium]
MNIDIPPKLKEYLDEIRAPLPPISDPDEQLHIDSMALIRLVAFLESDLDIRVEDEDLVADNFATLGTLHALLQKKQATADPVSA